MELLNVKNLTFTYPTCDTPAVTDVSFSVQEGEFVVVCGATGSGKSTLLRLLKPELAPLGEQSGEIIHKNAAPGAVGFVMQNPRQQIVTDKVWHELAFGLENMGVPQPEIARRVAEMASYFGIESWYEKDVCDLSGGQQQLLNLAAVMVMHPDLLILDEPTAQLDPIATSDFIGTLQKLNRDFSLTILIVEHRLEELIPISDKLLVLEEGRLVSFGAPRDVIGRLQDRKDLLAAMPAAARLYHALGAEGQCPLTVREGRDWMMQHFSNAVKALPEKTYTHSKQAALSFHDVYFRYEKHGPDVLRAFCLTVYEGEIYCVLGGNGSGKTTSLCAAAGFLKPYSGTIQVFGKKLQAYRNQSLYRECLAMLPQDVQTVFLKNTVREELAEMHVDAQQLPFDFSGLYEKHPYDLSGGEQQLVALAKVLGTKPRLLLLDEPTKGLDAQKKRALIGILKQLKASGVTVVIVTHDVEFTALCADRCGLFFHGNLVSEGVPTEFFSQNMFYTTAVGRMTKGYYNRTVTVEQAAELCRKNGVEHGGGVCW